MNAPQLNLICTDSRLWYYDFLFETRREKIPSITLKHIETCQYCQNEIQRLESLLLGLKEPKDDITRKIDNTINTLISLHLALVDVPVTCDMVKAFIPRLTDPLLQITIPTPINVHLDKCRACTDDFNTIKNLGLNREQLGHLGQLLADATDEKNEICSTAHTFIPSITSMDFKGISTDVMKHICTCSDCRREMIQSRQKLYEKLIENKNLGEESVCKKISMSDIFYLCLSYGYNHDSKFPKNHILSCPECLKKMQQLLLTINNIAERPNSNVITKFSLGKSDKPLEEDMEDIYSGWPISVQVIYKTPSKIQENTYQSELVAKQRSNSLMVKIKKHVKPLATAAVILLSLAMFFYSSSARAIDFGRMVEALKNVNNAYITRSIPGKSTPIQEEWVSRTFNVIITKTKDQDQHQYVLWDIQNNIRKIKYTSSNSIENLPLPKDMYTKVAQSIVSVLHILPFQNEEQIPKNANWYPLNEKLLKNKIAGTIIYELVWTDNTNIFRKCRFFVDSSTYLVQKTEYYSKLKKQEEYVLESLENFEYIKDTQVEEVLKIFRTDSNK